MAVNSSRSMNAELREGTTDGKYRKARPNTSLGEDRNAAGVSLTRQDRSTLHSFYGYGWPNTEIPDGQRVSNTR